METCNTSISGADERSKRNEENHIVKDELQSNLSSQSSFEKKLNTKDEDTAPGPQDKGDGGQNHIANEDGDNSWLCQIQKRFHDKQYEGRQPSNKVSIYRVPQFMRSLQSSAYDPQVVFLGPYNKNKRQQLSAMDDHKLKAVQKTLSRLPDMTMENLVQEVQNLETEIRYYYEDNAIEWEGETFAWMLTIDACFILEFIRQDIDQKFSLIFQDAGNLKTQEILWDILKLENQIPFCILKHILQLEFKSPENVTHRLAEFLSKLDLFNGFPFSKSGGEEGIRKHIGACHLLDLYTKVIEDFLNSSDNGAAGCSLNCCVDVSNAPAVNDSADDMPPSAVKLNKAGIKFRRSNNGHVLFDDRWIRRSIIFLPPITINDNTEILLRNLMAFEECRKRRGSPSTDSVVSFYICLIDSLIESKEDVALLRKTKIITSLMGSDKEIATVFNSLCKGISPLPDHQYQTVQKKIRQHYDDTRKVWMSEFREQYCSRPWFIVSLVVGSILTVMAAVRFLFYFKN